MGSHDGVVPWLHCTRRQVGSKYNSELGSPTFRHSSYLSSTSLAVCRRPQSFILLSSSLNGTLRFHRSLCSGAVPVTLSLLPLLSRSSLSWADGSKTHRRGVQSNCRGEW